MRETIGGALFAEMLVCAHAALEENRQQINELNVFPVPDGDTGTNMSLTMAAAVDALRQNPPDTVGAACDTAASALLRGARGNSGVILSLLFRGIAKSLRGKKECNAQEFAKAMTEGVSAAYKAVMKPTEGTILTVSRLASEAAVDFAKAGTDIEQLLNVALDAAHKTLALTVEMNPVLKKAGVVDAGGKGYIVIFEAMLACMQGRFTAGASGTAAPPRETADFAAILDEDINYTYCTEFIVSRDRKRSPGLLRSYLESVGDSLVLVDDREIIKVHIHTDKPGKVLSEAQRYGALQTVKIENMRLQHSHLAAVAATPSAKEEEEDAAPEKPVGFVAVCAGEGMTALFKSLGADRVVTGGQTMNPSTQDILLEIKKTPAETVFVFPNNKNIIMAAEQCVPLSDKKVVVIPTKSVPQGVSALAYMNPEAGEAELKAEFITTASRVHTALVTYAARDSEFDGNAIREGEYLALLDNALLGSYASLPLLLQALSKAFEKLEPEFFTVYYGKDATRQDALAVTGVLTENFPDAETSLVDGGQPVYYYMIAAE